MGVLCIYGIMEKVDRIYLIGRRTWEVGSYLEVYMGCGISTGFGFELRVEIFILEFDNYFWWVVGVGEVAGIGVGG